MELKQRKGMEMTNPSIRQRWLRTSTCLLFLAALLQAFPAAPAWAQAQAKQPAAAEAAAAKPNILVIFGDDVG